MQYPSRHRRAWIVIGVGFVLLVIHLSLTPHPVDVPSLWSFKVGHILAYAWLMFWFGPVYDSPGARAAIGVALLAMGIGLEYVQDMVGRDFSYTDMRDDGIGIVIGLAAAATPLGRALELAQKRWPA